MASVIDLSAEEVAQIKQLTKVDDESQAIKQAARNYLRIRKLQELKELSGKADFDDNWQELENLEIEELKPPL